MILLPMTTDQMEKYTNDMVKQVNSIEENAIRMSWYMRGGVTYNDIINMSFKQTEMINSVIDANLETTKKTKMPFF